MLPENGSTDIIRNKYRLVAGLVQTCEIQLKYPMKIELLKGRNMDNIFAGKNVLITGAAGGIGQAVAKRFAEGKANVILLDNREQLLIQVARDIEKTGVKAFPFCVNLNDMNDITSVFNKIFADEIAIDVLVNCAGISTSKLLIEVENDDWDRIMNVNLKSVWLISKLVARNMIEKNTVNGKIVSIASQAARIGEYGNGVYSISKAGIVMLTQVLSLELAKYGISVSGVCPGYINTDMMQEVFKKRGPIEGMTAEQYEKRLVESVPMQRMCESDEIADLIAYLASPNANYITGVCITIAGGKTLI